MSILTPVFNPPPAALAACIASVRAQQSPNWEWCVVDDASTEPHARHQLTAAAQADERIRVEFRTANSGIVATTNAALAMATGDVIAFLDHDDELTSDAIATVASTFSADPAVGIAYSDEELIDEEGQLLAPYPKPDFSPERLRSHNYFAHLVSVRRDYAVASGGLREGFDGAQDNDFDFRAVEHFGSATHIPKVLYRWRAVAGSVAADPEAKPSTMVSAERAVREHCERVGIDALVTPVPRLHFSFRLHRSLRSQPSIVFVVRPGDRGLSAILGGTLRSTDHSKIRVIEVADGPPVAAAFNAAVESTPGDLVLFLDCDARTTTGNLVDDLAPLTQDDDVAGAGPTLYLPDGRLGATGLTGGSPPRAIGFGEHGDAVGDWGIYRVTSEVDALALTGLCVRRDAFLALGGFDTDQPRHLLGPNYSARARGSGMRMLVCPFVGVALPDPSGLVVTPFESAGGTLASSSRR